MNHLPDVEPVLRAYLADTGDRAPDRVLGDVAARIAHQPRRRALRLPWRVRMNSQLKIAVGLAAALVIAVAGFSLLRGPSGPGGPGGSPSSLPTAVPTSTVAPVVALPDGTLTAGRYRIDLSFIDPGLSVAADVPGGWSGHPEVGAVTSPEGSDAGILLGFMEVDGLFSDPCRWDLDGTGSTNQPGDVLVGPTVGELVTALKANTSYTSSAPKPVTLGRFEGQELELQLPGDDILSTCDEHGPSSPFDGPAYFVFSSKDGSFYAQGPSSRWHLYIVDVDGTRLITMVSILAKTPAAEVAAAEAIVKSFAFAP